MSTQWFCPHCMGDLSEQGEELLDGSGTQHTCTSCGKPVVVPPGGQTHEAGELALAVEIVVARAGNALLRWRGESSTGFVSVSIGGASGGVSLPAIVLRPGESVTITAEHVAPD